jgi:hypothetical protein
MLDRPPSPAAVRQRRYKARQRNGRLIVTVELAPEEVDTLHRLGCVDLRPSTSQSIWWSFPS